MNDEQSCEEVARQSLPTWTIDAIAAQYHTTPEVLAARQHMTVDELDWCYRNLGYQIVRTARAADRSHATHPRLTRGVMILMSGALSILLAWVKLKNRLRSMIGPTTVVDQKNPQ